MAETNLSQTPQHSMKAGNIHVTERPEECKAQMLAEDIRLVQWLYSYIRTWRAVTTILGKSPAHWWKFAGGQVGKPLTAELRQRIVSIQIVAPLLRESGK